MVAVVAVMETAELVQPWLLREEEDGCGGDCGNGAGTVAVVLSLLVHRGPCAAEVGCALVEAREEDGGAAVKLARSVVVARTVAPPLLLFWLLLPLVLLLRFPA